MWTISYIIGYHACSWWAQSESYAWEQNKRHHTGRWTCWVCKICFQGMGCLSVQTPGKWQIGALQIIIWIEQISSMPKICTSVFLKIWKYYLIFCEPETQEKTIKINVGDLTKLMRSMFCVCLMKESHYVRLGLINLDTIAILGQIMNCSLLGAVLCILRCLAGFLASAC